MDPEVDADALEAEVSDEFEVCNCFSYPWILDNSGRERPRFKDTTAQYALMSLTILGKLLDIRCSVCAFVATAMSSFQRPLAVKERLYFPLMTTIFILYAAGAVLLL